MFRKPLLFPLFACAIAASSCTQSVAPDPRAAEEAAIRALDEQWSAAAAKNDLEATLSGRRGRDGRMPGSPSWNAGGDSPAWGRTRQAFEPSRPSSSPDQNCSSTLRLRGAAANTFTCYGTHGSAVPNVGVAVNGVLSESVNADFNIWPSSTPSTAQDDFSAGVTVDAAHVCGSDTTCP